MTRLYQLSTELSDLIRALQTKYEIYVPRPREKNGLKYIDWGQFEGIEGEINLDFTGQQKNSVKIFFFPQPEILLEFTYKDNKLSFNEIKPTKTRLILGVRPCDARSILLNKLHFSEDYYYINNINNNIIIGLSCKEQCKTCFCIWTGGSPLGTDGMDLCIHILGDKPYLEAITKRGEHIISELLGKYLLDASESVIQELSNLRQIHEKRRESFPDPVQKLKEKDLFELYDKDFWKDLSYSCINCGICTFLCPTCFCFDIQDETQGNRGYRIRYWDSCMFPLFTQHASGHNPRNEKFMRVRNRFMHKLKYYPDRYNTLSCVGCGRCIRECPVNIDIREVLRNML